MEGPPVRMVAEELAYLKKKRVESASGNARMEKNSFEGKQIEDVLSRGKNLFIKFLDISIRIHFLMYGSYTINEEKEGATPRLSLVFDDGMLNFYNCSVNVIGNDELEKLYDAELDISSEKWNADRVLRLVLQKKGELICDVLLDQRVFAGVGNIIKNEALFMARLHPLSVVGQIPEERLKDVISRARGFSMLFYEVLKRGEELRRYLKIYKKSVCADCKGKVTRKRTGKKRRISFFCPSCQVLYA